MEVELEARVKPLGFKVKALSRESSSQKAVHLLDTDLRNHWSTGTNTKEWILLQLDEPCLLSNIRIYNKSVLEWEISAGLQYKPETFVKVRPRCEAPRRDMIYPMNYTPCRYVRLSCLRGSPIAIFFIQLLISVPCLEPEFLPVVNYLLPHIIAHKQEGLGVHLRTNLTSIHSFACFLDPAFLRHLDLNNFSEAPESTLRFLAMLVGPIYLSFKVNEAHGGDQRTPPSITPTSSYFVFRPDVVFTFLRRAYKDSNLGKFCRMASRILLKLIEPTAEQEISTPNSVSLSSSVYSDYSVLFGEDFQVADDQWDPKFLNVLDIASVEEGIFHILYACVPGWCINLLVLLSSIPTFQVAICSFVRSFGIHFYLQPLLCSKLADATSDFWSSLPLVHALLPALRPNISSLDNIDDNFSQWKQPYVQHALSQVVATSSSPVYRPLLHACSGYLLSFSPSQENGSLGYKTGTIVMNGEWRSSKPPKSRGAKAASVLIDLCSGVLAPWIPQVVAKVDLALELLEDLLGIIQAAQHSLANARAALKCIVLALSGHMDDLMAKFKSGMQRILFLVEMLEPFLEPAMTPMKSTIAFGNVSSTLLENQEHNCDIALNVIHTALNKSAILPSIEAECCPSVLPCNNRPHLQLPPDIDLRKFPVAEFQSSTISLPLSFPQNGKPLFGSQGLDVVDGKTVFSDTAKVDVSEDASLLFAPSELSRMSLTYVGGSIDSQSSEVGCNVKTEGNRSQIASALCEVDTLESSNLKADYVQLLNYRECELRASEFRRLALDLQSHSQITPEGQEATVEALLLAAECYVNPYFQFPLKCTGRTAGQTTAEEASKNNNLSDIRNVLHDSGKGLEIVSILKEKKGLKTVLEILLEAANAITLVRQNQALLCNFLVQHLQKEQQSMHEILIQSLLFYLNSATRLFCSPECIVDIILRYAEYLNGLLKSVHYQFSEGSLRLDQSKLLKVRRHWVLLQKLVIASSGDNERPNLPTSVRSGHRILNLLPPSTWLQKVPVFSSSTLPLVRFFGWMAVSRNAKQYLNERFFLASDLTQLSNLLAIFSDDLALVDNIVEWREKSIDSQEIGPKRDADTEKESQLPDQHYVEQSLHAIYPDISLMFPNLKKEFKGFGETILEAVGLQLRSIPSSDVPDMLCWFSDLCKWPFSHGRTDKVFSEDLSAHFKGFASKNAKAVILYILEAIITQHIEAVVPEIPRMVQVILSLSKSRYCDVSFLDAILRLLKPVISYSLLKASGQENLSNGDSTQSSSINGQDNRALTIFVLASVFLSYLFLIHNLRIHGVIPLTMSHKTNLNIGGAAADESSAKPWFLGDIYEFSSSSEVLKGLQSRNGDISCLDEMAHHHLNAKEMTTFCGWLETLVSQLNSTIEQCCNLHPKLVQTLARDFVAGEVASLMLNCLLEASQWFHLGTIFGKICDAMKNFSCNAPNIVWRLRSDEWMSILFTTGLHSLDGSEVALIGLFCALLGHPEPELNLIALKHLINLLGQNMDGGLAHLSSEILNGVASTEISLSVSKQILGSLVSETWDQVVLLASSSTSWRLRIHGMAALIKSIPFFQSGKDFDLFSLASPFDSVLQCLARHPQLADEGQSSKFSLVLVASVCLYSPAEDIDLIPDNEKFEFGQQQKICEALCRLKNEGEVAKQMALRICTPAHKFILMLPWNNTHTLYSCVLSHLSSTQSYLDFFSKEIDQKAMELEEAETEMELLQQELAIQKSSNAKEYLTSMRVQFLIGELLQLMLLSIVFRTSSLHVEDLENSSLYISWYVPCSFEEQKAKLREEIMAHRQKKLGLRSARQKYLEDAAMREAELLKELDREKTAEMEKEFDRQRLLEIERAKTRELRHNLDIEKEKQIQRELQRELEQVESGLRGPRRDFSSSSHSRVRDRYRERENGRAVNESGNLRTTSNNTSQPEILSGNSSIGAMPKIVLAGGARQFAGPPTILQPHDRSDECGSSYEENFDGSRDSGDTGSFGDPEMVSSLDGQPTGYGSGQRQGSRGNKSRPVVERREREGRREGKWERKH
ncbi:hypothetical protein Leryth_025479 [Lithospermum erythrorhizon]|nr:hypothetical protein Leryth_025479 [Lithospermum erythrorhizon]